jgi:hypothetical protein
VCASAGVARKEAVMGVLDRFEKGVERRVFGAFSFMGRSEVKPIDLANGLRREADDKAAIIGRDRTIAPNEFVIALSPVDYEQIQSWGADSLAHELATGIVDHAEAQRYAFAGPVSVTFEEREDVTPSRVDITSASVRGAVAPAPAATHNRHPLIDVNGQRYLLTGPVTVIGRDASADIVVDDPGVSRRHLEIRVTPAGVVATDLGSTNGLFVEGHPVPAATLLDGNTLTIGHTRIMYWAGTPATGEW